MKTLLIVMTFLVTLGWREAFALDLVCNTNDENLPKDDQPVQAKEA